MKGLVFRETIKEDAPYIKKWLLDPKILKWFPMCNEIEVDDSIALWMSYLSQGASFTAVYKEKPCGAALLYLQPYQKLSHQCLFVIVVDEKLRGKGIGTKFLRYLIRIAKEKFHLEMLHLEVYEGNRAIHLYERAGFVKYGMLKDFLKEKNQYIGKILMQKIL